MAVRAWRSIALLLATAVTVGTAQAQTLTQALSAAYASNPTLQAARAALRGKDETIVQARADLWRPKVSINSGVTRTRLSQAEGLSLTAQACASFQLPICAEDLTPQSRDDNASVGVDVLLNLYKGGQTIAQINFAKAVIAAQRASLANTEQQVMLDVSQAYTEILVDMERRDLFSENERNLGTLKQVVDHFFKAQQATITEVAEVAAEVAQAKTRRLQAVGDLAVARGKYNALVGSYPISIRDWPKPPPLPATLGEATAIALRDNPSILAAQNTLLANEASLASAKGTVLPTVDFVMDWSWARDRVPSSGQADFNSYSSNYLLKSRSTNYMIGIKLNMPLYEGGALTSQIRQQREAVSQAKSQLEEATRATRQNLEAAWELVDAARSKLQAVAAQLDAARIALTGNERAYRDGHATVRDVLTARQKLNEAEFESIQSRQQLIIASERLVAAMGRYNAKSLELPVALYDPLAHYEKIENDFWR